MKTYKNVDEFLKENNLDRFNEDEKCFRRIVEELDFNTCKQILLRQLERDGVSVEQLKKIQTRQVSKQHIQDGLDDLEMGLHR